MLDIVFLVGSFFTQHLEYIISLNTIFSLVIVFFNSKIWLVLVYISYLFPRLLFSFVLFSFLNLLYFHFIHVSFSIAWPSLCVILDSLPSNSYTLFFSCFFLEIFFFFHLIGPFPPVHVLCINNFVLVPVHLKKQSPLPVFMDWLHTGKDLHSSAWIEILGAFQTFSVDVSLTTNLHRQVLCVDSWLKGYTVWVFWGICFS